MAALASLAVVAAGLPVAGQGASGSRAGDPKAIASHTVSQSAAVVKEYWTRARMRAAEPVDMRRQDGPGASPGADLDARGEPKFVLPSGPGVPETRSGILEGSIEQADGPQTRASVDTGSNNTAFPQRVHGKVFMTQGVTDYFCSGTVVRSLGHVLVWTAGHCVHGADIGEGFSTNFEFVPGYRDGQKPFGEWTATTLQTTSGWQNSADFRFDLGAVTLARHGHGRGIQDEVGSRGIAFNQPRNQPYSAFGYPAQSPFNGQRLFRCDSSYLGADSLGTPSPMRIACDMTAGSSGGGWVAQGQFVASATSYGYLRDFNCPAGRFNRCLYGSYQGDVAEQLYKRARGKKRTCGGAEVTNLGGSGGDDFDGTSGRDSFKLRDGPDTGDSGGGRDRLCGGRGRDLLIGGPGVDVCNGGKGRDRARGCEERRRIP
jgi:V8-like Glu-specific endopeptidase